MQDWKLTTSESLKRWEQNAEYWDNQMGEHSNRFHREIIRPATERLLELHAGDKVLDIACGNGNFSRHLAQHGAKVVAFDYSPTMIARAKERAKEYASQISFHVLDATNYEQMLTLRTDAPFDKAVANMALMDIADISPLLRALHSLIKPQGHFVFSISHPCFQTPHMRSIVEKEDIGTEFRVRHGILTFQYLTPLAHEGLALPRQPVPHIYYHRPLSILFGISLESGFVIDGLLEPAYSAEQTTEWADIPPALVVRLRREL